MNHYALDNFVWSFKIQYRIKRFSKKKYLTLIEKDPGAQKRKQS